MGRREGTPPRRSIETIRRRSNTHRPGRFRRSQRGSHPTPRPTRLQTTRRLRRPSRLRKQASIPRQAILRQQAQLRPQAILRRRTPSTPRLRPTRRRRIHRHPPTAQNLQQARNLRPQARRLRQQTLLRRRSPTPPRLRPTRRPPILRPSCSRRAPRLRPPTGPRLLRTQVQSPTAPAEFKIRLAPAASKATAAHAAKAAASPRASLTHPAEQGFFSGQPRSRRQPRCDRRTHARAHRPPRTPRPQLHHRERQARLSQIRRTPRATRPPAAQHALYSSDRTNRPASTSRTRQTDHPNPAGRLRPHRKVTEASPPHELRAQPQAAPPANPAARQGFGRSFRKPSPAAASFTGKPESTFAKFAGNKKPFGKRPPARKFKPNGGESA